MDISVRPAHASDVPALAELSGQLGYPVAVEEMAERLRRVRDAAVGEVFVAVAERDSPILGWTHVVPRLHLEEAPFAELAGLVVADFARSRGVGAALLAAAEAWARAAGFAVMRVRSNVVRERAHRFYERAGFQRVKAQAVFHKSFD